MAVFSTFLSFYLPLSLFLLSHLTLPSPVEGSANPNPSCPPSVCGELIDVGFLFTSFTDPGCWWHVINCDEDMKPTIKFEDGGRSYVVLEIRYGEKKIIIQDKGFYHHSKSNFCNFLYNFTVPTSPFLYFQLRTPNYTFVNCKGDHKLPYDDSYKDVRNYKGCEDSNLYSWPEHLPLLHDLSPLQLSHCSVTWFPLSDPHEQEDLFRQLDYGFELEWTLTEECSKCYENRGLCQHNSAGNFICSYTGKKKDKTRIIIIATGASAGAVVVFLALIFFFFLRIRNKSRQSISSNLLPRSISSDPYSKSELEKGIHTQVFEYKELEEATNNFDPSKELGDGGFGTVYHGKLRDGRFVAVKRLFENNYKQVEQFKNEIDILSRLRHQNLVALYGCSSRHRRELLLVYEFIPNGTVADHLHGDRVQAGTLTWPIRMSIAIETADALAYLHKVEIIHRDVKTNNILLDNNFRVKVADFGLSRLFPFDVTHVSTAPQGTPGYVDPDYRRCYQLTDKSDVYSFGVVLIELISSMPAVDISRHRHEINLSSMAIGKIHNDALHELVDPTLGFDSDFSVRRMITSVAELAIRCLQDEKEARPSMEEVLEELRGIESEEYMVEKTEEVGTPVDETALLKKNLPPSPDTVAKAWESRSTTPNTSG